MAKQAIGIGASANDGTGDTLRVALDKVNDNFDEIYSYQDIGAIAGASPTLAELTAVIGAPVAFGSGRSILIKSTTGGVPAYHKVYCNGLIYLTVKLNIA